MGDIYSPRDICTAARLYFTTDCCLSVLTWYDAVPPEDHFFDVMPMGIVDFEIGGAATFKNQNLGDCITFQPLRFEIYVEIEESDHGGVAANVQIWRLWWCLVCRLNGSRYLDGTVDGFRLTGGSVEGFPIESEEIGIKIRYAWLTAEVWRHL